MNLEVEWVLSQAEPSAGTQTKTDTFVPTQCDLNNDYTCNTYDLFIVIDEYGSKGSDLYGDANGDEKVNALDYDIVISEMTTSHLF